MRPNTIVLSTTTRLQLDGEERVPSFIAHYVQRHKIIPLSPFLYLALITSSRHKIFDIDLYSSFTKFLVLIDHHHVHQRVEENPICILQIGTPGPMFMNV